MTSQAKKKIPSAIPFYRPVLWKKEGKGVQGSPLAGMTYYSFAASSGPWKNVASALGISVRTLMRRRQEQGLPQAEQEFSLISDDELDDIIQDTLDKSPSCGEVNVAGCLRSQGLIIQRCRLRESLRRVDPVNRALRRSLSIVRRKYSVSGPNALW